MLKAGPESGPGTAGADRSPGALVYVIGPSGAGKDTLIARAREASVSSPEARLLRVARRRITRPAGAGGEDHLAMTEAAFKLALERGAFAMHWESHGLRYGIGREIDVWLASGAVVLVNGSRAYLPEAVKAYPHLFPVLVRVDPEALRQRLLDRGRERPDEIEERVRRASLGLHDAPGLFVIDNSGPVETAALAFCRLIRQLRGNAA